MKETNNASTNHIIEEMFKVGAHFGFSKSRRHPTVAKYIFGAKNNVEIFDLEKTKDLLDKAKGNSPRKSDNVIAPWGSEITFGEVTEKEDFKLEGEEMLWKEVVEYIKMMGY
jgi:hypothetical protein